MEAFGELEFAWALDDIGLSASQPVFVEGTIYHLTEKGLWKISFDAANRPVTENLVPAEVNEVTVNGAPLTRASTSGITYAEVGNERKRVLYFGTGSNKVCALALDTNERSCRQLFGAEPIVSTPLVFDRHDVVHHG